MRDLNEIWMKKPGRIVAIDEKSNKTVILSEERELPKGLKIKEELQKGPKEWKTTNNHKQSN
jgi:hypothetical protein